MNNNSNSLDSIHSGLTNKSNESYDNKCVICKDYFKDPIYMSCSSYHTFCFQCICKWIKQKGNDFNCPTCRGGEQCILLSSSKPTITNNYYSLCHFLTIKTILEEILSMKINKNTCMISARVIKLYMENKNNIELIEGYISNPNIINIMKLEDIIKCFKWNIPIKTCYCSYSNSHNYYARTFFGDFTEPPRTRARARTTNTGGGGGGGIISLVESQNTV